MNAIPQSEARAIQVPALETADPTKNLILVPLSRLVSRPTGRNVRKTPRMSIPELAASIQRVGLLQNLIVTATADGEHYEVVAGGRRLAALKLLAKKHRISKEWEVPCLLVADGTARTASLTENVQREAMHPADQFEAFAALAAEGRPIEDIAADFSVTPLVVQRRLKLANVSPRRKPPSTMRRRGSGTRPNCATALPSVRLTPICIHWFALSGWIPTKLQAAASAATCSPMMMQVCI